MYVQLLALRHHPCLVSIAPFTPCLNDFWRSHPYIFVKCFFILVHKCSYNVCTCMHVMPVRNQFIWTILTFRAYSGYIHHGVSVS